MLGDTRSTAASVLIQPASREALTIDRIELNDGHGIAACILTLGATLQSLEVPDRDGVIDDIVLGYDSAAHYFSDRHYFGSTVGRFANRIANGSFTLDGAPRTLARNDEPHHLHGGRDGFDRQLWTVGDTSEGDAASVTLHLHSPDGEEGYPGGLSARATYTLDRDQLTIEYRATTDAPTIVNLTNHSFFNLGGSRSTSDVMDHRLTLDADAYLPVDGTLIPTGEVREVTGTAFDFHAAVAIGARIRDGLDRQLEIARGYDHNFVVSGDPGALRRSVRLEDPVSGRVLEIAQTAPGLQFYSGNFLDGTVVGKCGRIYRQGDGVALEPQLFPDSPNRPAFPSARLDPGDTYTSTIVYRFSTLAK